MTDMELLEEWAYALAMSCLQSERYGKDGEFKDLTDNVLLLTQNKVLFKQ